MTPDDFIRKWRGVTQTERATAQSHFIDLCRLLGLPDPIAADPQGEWFCFEKGATKAGGGDGWADVWRRSCFGWEYKRPGGNLKKAFGQLQNYTPALEYPPLLIVSDVQVIEIHTAFTGMVPTTYLIHLEDLRDPAQLNRLKWAFTDPEQLKPSQTRAHLTEQAAVKLGALAQTWRARGHDPLKVAHFCQQVLFCLFAEDIDLLHDKLFTQLLVAAKTDPSLARQQFETLFGAMAQGGLVGFRRVDWFNGGLFAANEALPIELADIKALLDLAALDWSAIDPTIAGTLFVRSLDPALRAQLGAEYTDPPTIMRLVDPVVLDPLRAEWAAVKAEIQRHLDKAHAARSPGARTKATQAAMELYQGFLHRLQRFRVLDPACGSGNFLLLSLLGLKDLEHRVITEAEALGLPRQFPAVGPENVIGIEINPFAAELARVSLWIGEIQWMLNHGFALARNPILRNLDNIHLRDAVLNPDGSEPEWPEADVIVGNPPFLGDKKMLAALGEAYVTRLRSLYQGRVPGGADLVTYWFEKARAMIEAGKIQRAGLIATNSIRQRANRVVLERVKDTGNIFNVWPDCPWVLEGAAVRVSLVAFDSGQEQTKSINGIPVSGINADLTGTVDITKAKRLRENAGLAYVGDTKKGKFDVSTEIAQKILSLPLNPNGRPNGDVLKFYANAYDITQGSRGMWIIDFGVDMPENEAAFYEAPYAHVREHVKPFRDLVRNNLERSRWWLHARPAADLRNAISKLQRYIVTPQVSKYRIFNWLDHRTLPAHKLIAIARMDDYFLGVLHARPHEIWSLRQGSWQGKGNDPVYTHTTCFETYPFPWPPGLELLENNKFNAISETAKLLIQLRNNWLKPDGASTEDLKGRNLTNLYNLRPHWLVMAHQALDAAVAAAYGWEDYTPEMADEEILARLLALNLLRAG
ncbi:MAG: class I SAM-dependent DNA methyltransferase [Chromatiaceae bacterium]|nr:class I SAM-dependent DNA methyltransferase [Chromatiaceae bacterium]